MRKSSQKRSNIRQHEIGSGRDKRRSEKGEDEMHILPTRGKAIQTLPLRGERNSFIVIKFIKR